MSLWDLLQKDAEKKKYFDDYMTGRKSSLKAPWYEIFPAASELLVESLEYTEVTLVDVAGGQGHHVRAFWRECPNFPGRFILQGPPESIQRLDQSQSDGIEYMPYNFFNVEPIIGL